MALKAARAAAQAPDGAAESTAAVLHLPAGRPAPAQPEMAAAQDSSHKEKR